MLNHFLTKLPRTHNGEITCLLYIVSGTLDIHMQRNETEPLFQSTEKNQLEKNKDLNMKPESIQLLVEKLRGKIS